MENRTKKIRKERLGLLSSMETAQSTEKAD